MIHIKLILYTSEMNWVRDSTKNLWKEFIKLGFPVNFHQWRKSLYNITTSNPISLFKNVLDVTFSLSLLLIIIFPSIYYYYIDKLNKEKETHCQLVFLFVCFLFLYSESVDRSSTFFYDLSWSHPKFDSWNIKKMWKLLDPWNWETGLEKVEKGLIGYILYRDLINY